MNRELTLLALIEAANGSLPRIRAALALADRLGKEPAELCGLDPARLAAMAKDAADPGVRLFAACGPRIQAAALELRARLDRADARVVTLAEIAGHAAFLPVKTLPPVLTISGNASLCAGPMLGVVGARKASTYGFDAARLCGLWAAEKGIPVVSGGAAGVDTAAQEAALGAGGRVVVVLPQGMLSYDPPEYLRKALGEGRAALASMFHPDLPWRTFAATTRNDLIAALATAVCVIEPLKTGGSLRTGQTARDLGRPVLVRCANSMEGRRKAELLHNAGAMGMLGRLSVEESLDILWERALAQDRADGPQQRLC
jgi:DNA processing protein